jgi:hypothetical protein
LRGVSRSNYLPRPPVRFDHYSVSFTIQQNFRERWYYLKLFINNEGQLLSYKFARSTKIITLSVTEENLYGTLKGDLTLMQTEAFQSMGRYGPMSKIM